MRARTGLWLVLAPWAIASCHSDKHEPGAEPSSAESTQGAEDPIYTTPDGTIGPAVGPTPAPPGEGMGPGGEGPGEAPGGDGLSGSSGGAGGTGGELK